MRQNAISPFVSFVNSKSVPERTLLRVSVDYCSRLIGREPPWKPAGIARSVRSSAKFSEGFFNSIRSTGVFVIRSKFAEHFTLTLHSAKLAVPAVPRRKSFPPGRYNYTLSLASLRVSIIGRAAGQDATAAFETVVQTAEHFSKRDRIHLVDLGASGLSRSGMKFWSQKVRSWFRELCGPNRRRRLEKQASLRSTSHLLHGCPARVENSGAQIPCC